MTGWSLCMLQCGATAMPGTACSAAQGSCDFSDGAIGDTCMLAQCAWRLSPSVAPWPAVRVVSLAVPAQQYE